MIINTNMASLNTIRQLGINEKNTQSSLAKLSSGLRINSAADDAAGLAISEKMRGQIAGLNKASSNAQAAINLVSTAEGSLNETTSILQRMRELAVQGSNDTNTTTDRDAIQTEMNQLTSEINRIGNTTEFNTQKLLNGGIGRTAQIRYSISTAGASGVAAVGNVDVNTIANSIKASTAAVSNITGTASVQGALPVGDLSAPATVVASVAAGTGGIQNFQVDTASVKAENSGSIGDSFKVLQGSLSGDIAGAISSATELQVGASNAGRLGGFTVATASVQAGTGAIQESTIDAGSATASAFFGVEITSQFTAGDKLNIGSATLVAVATAGSAAADTFQIGSSLTDTTTNIIAALGGASNNTIVGGTTYDMSQVDTINASGYTDSNLIVFSTGASGLDANAATFTAANVSAVAATSGVYHFEVANNYEVGQKISINGLELTATTGASTSSTFKIGANVDETASAIVDALTAAGASAIGGYTASLGAGGIYSDTINLTENTGPSGVDLTSAVADVDLTTAPVSAVYAIEIKSNFAAGDKLTIGQETYTAVANVASGTAASGFFVIGSSITDTRDNIKTMIAATTDTNETNYTITTSDPKWNGDPDANLLVFSAKAAQTDTNRADMQNSAVDPMGAVQGQYGFEIAQNFMVGEKISVAGQSFTAVAAPVVGHTSAASVSGTLNSATYTAGSSGWTVGDTVTIAGQTFTAVSGVANAASGQFSITGGTASSISNSLASALSANTTISNQFTISQAAGSATFTLTEKNANGAIAGSATVTFASSATLTYAGITAASAAANAAVNSVDTYTITTDFAEGQKITIDGQTFTAVASGANAASGQFNIGADKASTAASLVSALNANSTISTSYTAAATSNGAFTLTGKTSGTNGGANTADATFDANTNSSFAIGATVTDTADNLMAAINKARTDGGTGQAALGRFDAATVSSGIYSDTITLTETAGQESGTDLTSASVFTTDVQAVNGVYSFEVSQNFSVNDSITIGSNTFTAVAAASGVSNTATTFIIGSSKEDTAANLKAAIALSTLVAGSGAYTVASGTDQFGYADKIVLTENTATGVNLTGPNVTPVTAVSGQYKMLLNTNFRAGETIDVGGQTFTAVASGANASQGQFNVGSSTDATAASLITALSSKLGSQYSISSGGGSIISFTESAAPTGQAITKGNTQGVGAVSGIYQFTVNSNFSVNDKITIAGKDFTAIAGSAVAGSGTFTVGQTLKETTDNLVAALNNDASISSRFEASTQVNYADPLNPVYSVKLAENVVPTGAVVDSDPHLDAVQGQQGVYTVDVSTNLANGDKLTIGDTNLIAGVNFQVGSTAADTAQAIKNAVSANATLAGRFTATQAGTTIALTENTGTGEDLTTSNTKVTGAATEGIFGFSMNALGAGSTVKVDDTTLTIATGGNESQTATEVKSLIDNDSTLSAKYNVAVSGADVTLTQKAGTESADKPTLSYSIQAGAGFSSAMQIGANTGQTMVVDIKDMRSEALGISAATSRTGQTVTVDGKQYGVVYTSTAAVTNGSDNVAIEFGLDISSADNATAAISVIDTATAAVSAERSKLGAYQNRLEHTINNLGTSSQNITSAEANIRDVDMAAEMTNFQKNNILQQAAQAMLAQANQQPQGVLQLLR